MVQDLTQGGPKLTIRLEWTAMEWMRILCLTMGLRSWPVGTSLMATCRKELSLPVMRLTGWVSDLLTMLLVRQSTFQSKVKTDGGRLRSLVWLKISETSLFLTPKVLHKPIVREGEWC